MKRKSSQKSIPWADFGWASDHVLLLSPHPHAGQTGKVVSAEITGVGPALRIKLSNIEQECYVYDKSHIQFIGEI